MSGIKESKTGKNMISIDIEDYAHRLWGVDPARIHGVSDAALLRLAGKLGHDFTFRFATYKEFCCHGKCFAEQ